MGTAAPSASSAPLPCATAVVRPLHVGSSPGVATSPGIARDAPTAVDRTRPDESRDRGGHRGRSGDRGDAHRQCRDFAGRDSVDVEPARRLLDRTGSLVELGLVELDKPTLVTGIAPWWSRRGFGMMGGPVIHGQFTIQGPNGYETLDERTGTVSSITNTSGSTWSLEVKSSDGTSAAFTVDSGTSVDGGEMGISSVKQGDTVTVLALDNNATATAKEVRDRTVLQNNASSWMPQPSQSSSSSSS